MVTRFEAEPVHDAELEQQAFDLLLSYRDAQFTELNHLLMMAASCVRSEDIRVTIGNRDRSKVVATYFPSRGQAEDRLQDHIRVSARVMSLSSDNSVYEEELKHIAHQSIMATALSDGNRSVIGAVTMIFDENLVDRASIESKVRLLASSVGGLVNSQFNAIRAQLAQQSERRARDLAMRKERLLEEVANVSGVGGWEFDVVTQELFWTRKTREIHEVDDGYIPSLDTAYDFYPEQSRSIITQVVEDGLKKHGIWDVEVPFVTAKGRQIWVKATGFGVYEGEELQRLIGGFQDITARKRQDDLLEEKEREARAQRNEFSAILANMSQGIAVYDAEAKLKYWNQRYLKILQLTENDITIGMTFCQIIKHLTDVNLLSGDITTLINKMQMNFELNKELRMKYRLGAESAIDVIYTPLPDKGWVTTVEDISNREAIAKQIKFNANHDSLTGLANRLLFNKALTKVITTEPQARPYQYTLLLLDLDGFKAVNDNYGHIAGDEVLIEVSRRLHSIDETFEHCQSTTARLGGDEFAILLAHQKDTHALSEAKLVAQMIHRRLCRSYTIAGKDIHIGVSIGIAQLLDIDVELREWIHRADTAMYSVKKSRKSGYHVSNDEERFDNES